MVMSEVVEYTEQLAQLQRSTYSIKTRKSKGQIFTPGTVARFMANLLTINSDRIRLLDPGAGTGILTAAICEHLAKHTSSPLQITVDAYENDTTVIPKLEDTLEQCQKLLKGHNHEFQYRIFQDDFILHNAGYFSAPLFLGNDEQHILYDVVIANPPYYKLNKHAPQAQVMLQFVHGQPNIYALFIALAVSMLKENGQAVFITPRSFCSGVYYQKLREWFLSQLHLTHIHLFESRKGTFDEDGILQENIIFRGIKKARQTQEQPEIIHISTSLDKTFRQLTNSEGNYQQVVFKKNGHFHIRIPASPMEFQILDIIDSWPNTLHSLGLEISTGPVVHFRAKEHLSLRNEGGNRIPLLWMHNLLNWLVEWPVQKNNKEQFISQSPNARKWLIPVKNYVLLKRFTSKEQQRRLYASAFLQSDFRHYQFIGLENHLNYIHRPKGNLTEEETYGLAALLNTTLIDVYFRVLNGNTQVNASDIRILPLPSIETIRKIGERILQGFPQIGCELDTIVAQILNLDLELVRKFVKEEMI